MDFFLFACFYILFQQAGNEKLEASFQLVCSRATAALTASPGWKHSTSSSTLTYSRLHRSLPRPLEAPLTLTMFSSAGPAEALCTKGPPPPPPNRCPVRHFTPLRWKEEKTNSLVFFCKGLDTFQTLTFLLISYSTEILKLPLCCGYKRNTCCQLGCVMSSLCKVLAFWAFVLVFFLFLFFSDDKMCSLMFNRSFILKREKKNGPQT